MRILLTGAHGFIGQYLHGYLRDCGHSVFSLRARTFHLQEQKSWLKLCMKIKPSVIIHLAGLAHRSSSQSMKFVEHLWDVNVRYPVRLASVASDSGVPRFLFASSIGVHGSLTADGEVFHENSPFNPDNAYAESKCKAELLLKKTLEATSTQLVTVRPALVCGRGAPGNIRRLARIVQTGIPLPLSSVKNQRSFVVIENLCDLFERAATYPVAADETFVAAEPSTLSISEVISCMASHWGRSSRVWPCSQQLLLAGFKLVGLRAQSRQLLGSLVVDSSKARTLLDWQSKKSLCQSLRESAHSGS